MQLAINQNGYELLQPSPENKLLKEWTDVSFPVTRMSVFPRNDTITYASFFPMLTELLPRAAAFKKKINTPNAGFNEPSEKIN